MPTQIVADSVSKRFKRDWIFRNVSHTFESGSKTAILGSNGSGKSTFLKIISGYVGITEGNVSWNSRETTLDLMEWHNKFTYCAPYLELIEEFNLDECLDFHFKLKTLRSDVDLDQVLHDSGLERHKSKLVSLFSSGMKQRLKLILALATEVDVYLLDEPCSNLDEKGIEWYKRLVTDIPASKTVLVGSNSKEEYGFCSNQINIEDYK